MNRALRETSRVSFVTSMVAATMSFGCGGGDASTNVQEKSLVIQAYVEGTVTDGVTHTPIQGATVTLPGFDGAGGGDGADPTDGIAHTDRNGFFSLGVPGVGSHTLFVSAADYARAKYSFSATTEPGASGNIRVTAVRNSQLYPTSASDGGVLSGRVTSGGGRDVIAGARVLVQFSDNVDPIEDANLEVTTETDDEGQFSLENLPAGSPQTRVTVFPVDIDGDGTPDTAIYSNFVSGGPGSGILSPGGQNFMDIVVDQFIADKVLWTNLDDGGSIDADESLTLHFGQPMLDTNDSTLVTLSDGVERVKVDFEWSDGVELSITPTEPLLAGHTYSLNVQTQSAAGGAVAFSRSFFVTSADAPPDAVTGISLVDPDPLAWNAKSFTLAWDAAADADGNPIDTYRVLARNDARRSTWVILFEGAVSRFGRPQLLVTLPDGFDTFPSEDVFSAVGFGTTVEFAVQPYSGRNDGPISEEFATLEDKHCPYLSVIPPLTTDNTLGTTDLTVKVVITSPNGEPLSDASTAKFTFADGASSTDPFVITGTPEVRRVRADEFEYSFTVPKGKSGFADTMTVDLSKMKDTSNNSPDGTLTCPKTASFTLN
jgi:hypothetical protein